LKLTIYYFAPVSSNTGIRNISLDSTMGENDWTRKGETAL